MKVAELTPSVETPHDILSAQCSELRQRAADTVAAAKAAIARAQRAVARSHIVNAQINAVAVAKPKTSN